MDGTSNPPQTDGANLDTEGGSSGSIPSDDTFQTTTHEQAEQLGLNELAQPWLSAIGPIVCS